MVWLTNERHLAFFRAGTIVKDPPIVNLWQAASKISTCAEPEFRLCWMKFCSSDNYYTMAPLVSSRTIYLFILYKWLTAYEITIYNKNSYVIVKWGKNRTNLTNLSVIRYLLWPSLPYFIVLINWSLAFMNK